MMFEKYTNNSTSGRCESAEGVSCCRHGGSTQSPSRRLASARHLPDGLERLTFTLPPAGSPRRWYTPALIITLLSAVTACTSSQPPLDYIGPNMVKGPSIKAQRADCRMDMTQPVRPELVEGQSVHGSTGSPRTDECIPGMRVPPKGAIPHDYEPYAYADDAELAGKMLKNPLRPTRAILQRGQILFNIYCAVCHGATGDGSGYIVPKFPQPPILYSEKVGGWSDGRIFHVITRGQNLMPSYASQVTADERWAIVHFVRALQRAAHPSDADMGKLNKK